MPAEVKSEEGTKFEASIGHTLSQHLYVQRESVLGSELISKIFPFAIDYA